MSYCQKVCYTRYAVSNRVVFTLNSLTVSCTRSAGGTAGREVWYADELWETEWGASPAKRMQVWQRRILGKCMPDHDHSDVSIELPKLTTCGVIIVLDKVSRWYISCFGSSGRLRSSCSLAHYLPRLSRQRSQQWLDTTLHGVGVQKLHRRI